MYSEHYTRRLPCILKLILWQFGNKGSLYSARPQFTRRVDEEKANVVASLWGEEFIKFLSALAGLPRTILNNRMISFFSF